MEATLLQAIQGSTAIVVPLVVSGLRLLIPNLPKWLLPIGAAILGVGADLLTQFAAGASLGMIPGALLGLAGVGIREIVDQLKKAGAGG